MSLSFCIIIIIGIYRKILEVEGPNILRAKRRRHSRQDFLYKSTNGKLSRADLAATCSHIDTCNTRLEMKGEGGGGRGEGGAKAVILLYWSG